MPPGRPRKKKPELSDKKPVAPLPVREPIELKAADEKPEPKPVAVKTVPKEEKKKPDLYRWLSLCSTDHMIAVPPPLVEKVGKHLIRFVDHVLVLDPRKNADMVMHRILSDHQQNKVSFVWVNDPDGDTSIQGKAQAMKLLRQLCDQGQSGLSVLRGMFTVQELIDNGVPPSTQSSDELAALALMLNKNVSNIDM